MRYAASGLSKNCRNIFVVMFGMLANVCIAGTGSAPDGGTHGVADSDVLFSEPPTASMLKTLSMREAEATEGAFGLPGAILGGAYGGIQYGVVSAYTGEWSNVDFAKNVGGGALAGGVAGPVTALRAVWKFNAAVGAGIAEGAAKFTENNARAGQSK